MSVAWEMNSMLPHSEYIAQNITDLLKCATEEVPWHKTAVADRGIEIWQKETGGIVSMKLKHLIPASVEKLSMYLLDVTHRKEWDLIMDKFEVRETLNEENDIIWLKFKAMHPAQEPKDFALLRSWRIGQEIAVIANHSVVHESVPPVAGVCRAEVLSSGFIIEQQKDDIETCALTYVAQVL